MSEIGSRSWFNFKSKPEDEGLDERWRMHRGRGIKIVEDVEPNDEGFDILNEYEQSIEEEQDINIENEGIVDESTPDG